MRMPRFPRDFPRCAKRNAHTNTHTVTQCLFIYCIRKMWISSIICVHIFGLRGANESASMIWILCICLSVCVDVMMFSTVRTPRATSLTTSQTSLLDIYKTKIHMLPMITHLPTLGNRWFRSLPLFRLYVCASFLMEILRIRWFCVAF